MTNLPIRRIELLGGPNSGKSTNALYLTADLKMMGYNVELVTEVVKKMAYRGIRIEGRKQWVACDRQIEDEEDYLDFGVDTIITDSPLILHYLYSRDREEKFAEAALEEIKKQDTKYETISILLNREGLPYRQLGRFQTLEEAIEIDRKLKAFLDEIGKPYIEMFSRERATILGAVRRVLGQPTLPVTRE